MRTACVFLHRDLPTVVTTAPVYLTHQNLTGYISAISKPIHFWLSPKLSAIQGLKS